jgi:Regulator of chromosome condensation (RCC1) repeat
MGIFGELGRSANMTKPMDANGDYDLGLKGFYGKEVKENVWYPDESIVLEKFLKPLPPIWAEPTLPDRRRFVRAVACGFGHMLVLAQDDDGSHAKVYSCGLNECGQLGHGDKLVYETETQTRISNNRHALTLVSLPFNANGGGPSLATYLTLLFSFLPLR